MNPFDSPEFDDHEQVAFFCEPRARLRTIIAVHSTAPMGVAGGGVRMWRYRDPSEALRDVLRLSKAMSYKLALMGLPAGGGKAVILGDPARDKSEALLLAFGRAVNRLGGKFIAGEDVGTSPADLRIIGRETPFVAGSVGAELDGASATARGVVVAIRTALARSGRELEKCSVLVQGVGRVGFALAAQLVRAGAEVRVADANPLAAARAARELGVSLVDPADALAAEVDVLAPCALGDVFDEASIKKLRCSVIAGSANNQLADERAAELFAPRGILYCPDFVVNAAGVLAAARRGIEALGPVSGIVADVDRIRALLLEVIARAEREGISTHLAAVDLAKDAIAGAARECR